MEKPQKNEVLHALTAVALYFWRSVELTRRAVLHAINELRRALRPEINSPARFGGQFKIRKRSLMARSFLRRFFS